MTHLCCPNCPYIDTIAPAPAQVISDMTQRIAELEQPWISVEDRLPDNGTWVLGATSLFNGRRIAKELFLDSDSQDGPIWLAEGDWEIPVTHWMPLPEPPE